MLGVSQLPTFDTATFCVCVLAVGIRVTHGVAGSTGISNFFWCSEQRCQVVQLRQKKNRKFSLSGVQLEFWVSQYSIADLLSFEHMLDDHTSGHIVSGLGVTCILVNLPSTDE